MRSEIHYVYFTRTYETVAGLPDLARLVHGNWRSIQKLVREFCEFWRSKNHPDTPAGDVASDENAPEVKVSKRKCEAKIREIAVYEFRPQFHKHKLWYVNDKTLEKLKLSLPVPTEWKWITLASAKSGEENDAAGAGKQSVSVSSVPLSATPTNGTIKSFMSSVTPNGAQQQSPAGNSVNMNASCGIGKSPSQDLQQSPFGGTTKVESVNAASPVPTSVVCDNGAAASAKPNKQNAVRPASTPCSGTSAAKKCKVQSVRRSSLPTKQQQCLLFSRKPKPPATVDDDCVVVDSCSVKADNNVPTAAKPNVEQSDSNVKSMAQQPADDDDCMIVDSCVLDSEYGNKPEADKERAEPRADIVGNASNVRKISDEKTLPETDANCNVCVESSVNNANRPVETTADVDN